MADLDPYKESYSDLNRLRDDYDVTARFQDYLASLEEFLDPVKHKIDVESLRTNPLMLCHSRLDLRYKLSP